MKRRLPEPEPAEPAHGLEMQALWALEHPEEVAPRKPLQGLQRRLRLWLYPVRGTPKAWALFMGGEDDRPLVREVAWAKQTDARHSLSPMRRLKRHPRPWPGPTIHVRDAELFLADVQPFMDWASRAGFQTSPTARSLDGGDAQGIEGSGSLTHLRIEWKGDTPRDLEEPAYWIERLRRVLEAAVAERGRAEA
ncbi:MAG TPA: hypothetical protein VEJ18_02480 [Planctomycetota bacterium]|nr:hypothetical protein [Planctomycetota bacterium]